MLHSLLVKDYMVGDRLVFRPDTPLLHAVHTLLKHGLSGAPVVDDDDRPIGFLSERDCLKAALTASYYEENAGLVREHMSHEVHAIGAESTLIDAIQSFLTRQLRCLAVIESGRVIGQISRRDILAALEKLRR